MTLLGSARRWALSPSLSAVGFAQRGFTAPRSAITEKLEAVPRAVICGFEWGMECTDLWELERRLELIDEPLRGFSYEGAVMAGTILDAMTGGSRVRDLLTSSGRPHILLAYIGIGFAMARLPRRLWNRVLPDLAGVPYHPELSWLAVDGYGFDLAYFHTRRWVHEQRIPANYPWESCPSYFARAFDQGVGRALWFIHGAMARDVAVSVQRFAPHRRADLWSGIGLAAAFVGAVPDGGFGPLGNAAAQYRLDLAVGAVLAGVGRVSAQHVPEATTAAMHGLAGVTAADVAALAAQLPVVTARTGSQPLYERWRRHVRSQLHLPSIP